MRQIKEPRTRFRFGAFTCWRPLAAVLAGRHAKHVWPCIPTSGKVVLATDAWLHEIKYDGFRQIVLRGLGELVAITLALGLFFVLAVLAPFALDLAGASVVILLVFANIVVVAASVIVASPTFAALILPRIGERWSGEQSKNDDGERVFHGRTPPVHR
jgi:hypothetical protein